MPFRIRALILLLAPLLAGSLEAACAQHSSNGNATYQQLRGLLPGGDVILVNNMELRRDAATLTFTRGNFAFYGEVNGKVTGAVFKGDGHFHLTPPTASERHNLSVLNHAEEFDEDFDEVVLRFTDGTAAELRKGSAGNGVPDEAYEKAARALYDFQRLKLKDNLDLRLLEDVLSPAPGEYFLAAIRGRKNPHLIFTLDPHGAPEVAPEEVSLLSWNEWGETYPAAFHQASDAIRGGGDGHERNATYRIDHEDLDVSIETGGLLTGLATVHLTAEQDGVAVAQFDLYPTLRVSRVETDESQPLGFVQERKDEDADFGVVLSTPLKKGESTTIRVAYGGKDVVRNEGGANYYPIARQSWYPNAPGGFGDFATYHMRFHVPKGLQLIATGTRIGENTAGKITTTEWKTDVPVAVVGFNLGRFAMKEAKLEEKQGSSLTIDAYANTSPPSSFVPVDSGPQREVSADFYGDAMGKFDAPSKLLAQLTQAQAAAQLYAGYFGQLPFSQFAVTQQFACDYGQSWPMLVFLPSCAFMDSSQQYMMGVRPADMYWRVVTPHEVAHQWWGQTVGFRSYRDQWMSEGFADASASIYLQAVQPKPGQFIEFWKQQRKLITEKNAMGFRPIDVGPVTMGFRLNSPKTGWNVYQNLVYPKGAYILHMIRMMMWSPQDGDALFRATMQDFLASYRLQAATTEDFKAVVERHMSRAMDLDGNHRMDWFFNQYVYGTDLPSYHFESQIAQNGDTTSLHFKITQSGVPANFRMLVPIYLELADGRVVRLGSAAILGSMTAEQTVPLPKLPAPVKRALINYYYDVLATEN
jgi:hypothetical protein